MQQTCSAKKKVEIRAHTASVLYDPRARGELHMGCIKYVPLTFPQLNCRNYL